MTVQNPAWALAAEDQTPASWRRMLQFTHASRAGVLSGLAVTQRSGTTNMSVDVSDGAAIVAGTEASTSQGFYFVENQGVQNVTVTAAHPTLQRRDLVVARVRDAQYSGATNAWALEVVAGTAAATPLFPAIPANSLVLAAILVPAAATVITNAAIADLRSGSLSDGTTTLLNRGYAAAAGGRILCTSGTRPSSPTTGTEIFESDTNLVRTWAGTNWVSEANLGPGESWSPTVTQGVAVAYTLARAAYARSGRRILGEVHFTASASGTANQPITVTLPFNRSTSVNYAVGSGWWLDSSVGTYYPVVCYLSGTNTLSFITANGTFLGAPGSGLTQLASGDIGSASFSYEAAT